MQEEREKERMFKELLGYIKILKGKPKTKTKKWSENEENVKYLLLQAS